MATPSEVVGIVRPSRLLVLECGRMTFITNLFDSEGEPTEDVYEAAGAVAPLPAGRMVQRPALAHPRHHGPLTW